MRNRASSEGELERKSSLLENVKWGAGYGAAFAVAYTLFVCVVALVGGTAPFREDGVSLGQIVGLYFVSGILVGGVVGIMRPLTGRRLGAAFVGFVAALPLFAVMLTTQRHDPLAWGRSDYLFIVIMAAVAGPPAGLILWSQTHRKSRD
jgi:hypothetical protein